MLMMNSTHDDAVLNFDLDFLHPATTNVPISVLKQKYITQLKRRIIRVDALQSHRNAINQELNSKSKELEDIKKKLESTTLEYTRTSLDYKEALESSVRWEKETQKLNLIIKDLDSERLKAVNQLAAIQSHVGQLEQLVKQQERKIDSLERYDKKNVDKLIAEKVSAKTKECEKEMLLWKKKFESLRKQLLDKNGGGKKLSKELLRKHDKLGSESIGSPAYSEAIFSDIEDNVSDDFTVSLDSTNPCRNNVNKEQRCPITSKDIRMDLDGDSIHEVVSVDTGCGSSLSSSDNEKWLNSPDFVFSPIQVDGTDHIRGRKCINTATSPIPLLQMISVATSPLPLVKMVEAATSPIQLVKLVDVATNTNFSDSKIDVATSPVKIQIENHDYSDCKSNVSPMKRHQEKHQKYRLDETSKVINKVQENNKKAERRVIDNGVASTVVKGFKDISQIDKTQEKEHFDRADDEWYNDDDVDCTDFRGFENTRHTETQQINAEESLRIKINASGLFDDHNNICYGALKTFDKMDSKAEKIPENEYLYIKINEPCIFDDEITPTAFKGFKKIPRVVVERLQNKYFDEKMNEYRTINYQTDSAEIKCLEDVPHAEVAKIKHTSSTSNKLDEDYKDSEIPSIPNSTIGDKEIGDEESKDSESASNKMEEDSVVDNGKPTIIDNGVKEIHDITLQSKHQQESLKNKMDEDIIDNGVKEKHDITLQSKHQQESLKNKMDEDIIDNGVKEKHDITLQSKHQQESLKNKMDEDIIDNGVKEIHDITLQSKHQQESLKNKMDEDIIDNGVKEIHDITLQSKQQQESLKNKMDEDIIDNGVKEIHDITLQSKQQQESLKNKMDEDIIDNGVKEKHDITLQSKHQQESLKNKMDEDGELDSKKRMDSFKGVENIPATEIQILQERECLELNNSNNIKQDRVIDTEIEMILNAMRMHHKLITPMPRSPKSSCCSSSDTRVAHAACPDAAIAREHAATAKEEAANARLDAAKTREDNRKLMSALDNLMKDMFNIKSFLKNRLSMPDALLESNNNLLDQNSLLNQDDIAAAGYLPKPLAHSELDHSRATSARPRDIKITVLSDEIIKPADPNYMNEKRLLEKSSCGMDLDPITEENELEHPEIKTDIKSNEAVDVELQTKDAKSKRNKRRKLTNLDKYRKKCEVRKSKIKRETPPLVKQRLKPKRIQPTKKVTNSDNAATLNDSDVYAKAVKVMAELNAKKAKLTTESVTKPGSQNTKIEEYSTETKRLQDTTLKDPISSPEPVKSLQSQSTTLTHVVACPRRSITSPAPVLVSPTPIVTSPRRPKGPSESVTSPTAGMTSAKGSITSPELVVSLTRINSPKSFIQYPEVNVTSEISIPTPRYSLRASEVIVPPIKDTVTSPRCSVRSPELAPSSPRPTAMSLKPNYSASRPSIASPEAGITYVELSHTSSRPATTQPEAAGTYSRQTKPLSKHGGTSSTPVITSPKPAITSPKPAIASPKPAITPPKLRVTPHKLGVKSPKLRITSPKLSIITAGSHNYVSSPRLGGISPITTRSRSKSEKSADCLVTLQEDLELTDDMPLSIYSSISSKDNQFKNERSAEQISRKRTRSNCSEIQCKRVLRSTESTSAAESRTQSCDTNKNEISTKLPSEEDLLPSHPRESILCVIIEKYGIKTVRQITRYVPDTLLNTILHKIETCILNIKETSGNHQKVMNELVEELLQYKYKDVVSALVKYLTDPQRKMDLLAKGSLPPAPQMTKSEEILLYVIRQLATHWTSIDIVDIILSAIEHSLFRLTRTPEFEVIEGASHFYALICRYFNKKSRLIAFMLDAMYCVLFKSVPLIKQCLDVWPHVIPLAHMSVAKTPLVTCFVYLLHFYKCEDKYARVQEIRNLLNRKYFYNITEWNETKILELFSNAIRELRDIPNENKMLRIALIILGKRHGPQWTQNNIIKKMFQPFIENDDLPENVKEFCIAMIGPLMKPYPIDMKVHCEIAMNQLADILNTTKSKKIEEAALTSIVIMHRHCFHRVIEILLSRRMRAMSPEVEKLLCSYVRVKPLNAWLKLLARRKPMLSQSETM